MIYLPNYSKILPITLYRDRSLCMPYSYNSQDVRVVVGSTDVLASQFNITTKSSDVPVGVLSLRITPIGRDVEVRVEAACHTPKSGETFDNMPLPDATKTIRPSYDAALKETFGRGEISSLTFSPPRPTELFGLKIKGASLLEVATALEDAKLAPEGTSEAAKSLGQTLTRPPRLR